MSPFFKDSSLSERGFTLVELMVTVAIIGLLATVAIPNYQKFSYSARIIEQVSEVSAMKISVELVKSEYDSYPASALIGRQPGAMWTPTSPPASGALGTLYALLPVVTDLSKNDCYDPATFKYLYQSDSIEYKILAHCMTNRKYSDGAYIGVTSALIDPMRVCPVMSPCSNPSCSGDYFVFGIAIWSSGATCW